MTKQLLSVVVIASLSSCAIDTEPEPSPVTVQAVTQPPACISTSGWPSTYCGIVNIISDIESGIKLFNGVSGAFTVVEKILQFIGALPTVSPFAALSAQINQVAGDLSWQMQEIQRENEISTLTADADGAAQWLELDGSQPLPPDSATAEDSQEASYALEQPNAFQRLYNAAIYDPSWTSIVTARPVQNNGYVYDWRLGVPAAIYGIALRLQVIAAEDSSFKSSPTFQDELMNHHRATLLAQIPQMIAGVSCSTGVDTPSGTYLATYYIAKVRCADINTGAFEAKNFSIGPTPTTQCLVYDQWHNVTTVDHPCMVQAGYDLAAKSTILPPAMAAMRRDVIVQMPLFDIQAVADMLYMFAHPSQPELAHQYSRIPIAANTGLCLDVVGGVNADGQPVQLYACNATPAQHWTYDRTAQTITNTSFGKCLDVRGNDPTPGTPVQIYDCNGTDAQRWTYDPTTGAIANKRGNVLDVQNGNIASGAVVQTWPSNGTAAQKWYPDGPPIIIVR